MMYLFFEQLKNLDIAAADVGDVYPRRFTKENIYTIYLSRKYNPDLFLRNPLLNQNVYFLMNYL